MVSPREAQDMCGGGGGGAALPGLVMTFVQTRSNHSLATTDCTTITTNTTSSTPALLDIDLRRDNLD